MIALGYLIVMLRGPSYVSHFSSAIAIAQSITAAIRIISSRITFFICYPFSPKCPDALIDAMNHISASYAPSNPVKHGR